MIGGPIIIAKLSPLSSSPFSSTSNSCNMVLDELERNEKVLASKYNMTRFQLRLPVPNHYVTTNLTGHMMNVS